MKNQIKPCLKPHPKFELVLKCKDSGEIVKTWQLRMISDEDSEYPNMQHFIEAMDEYDGNMPCDCENCNPT